MRKILGLRCRARQPGKLARKKETLLLSAKITNMNYLLATAAVLALTSVSATGAERYQPHEYVVTPPAEYDKPFVGKLEEFIAKDQEELASFCWGLSVLGCAKHWPASESGPPLCDIYLAPDELIRKRGLTTEIVRRHEMAHCNGWSHPDAPNPPQQIDPWSLKVSKP
jgi:hypothetical protein